HQQRGRAEQEEGQEHVEAEERRRVPVRAELVEVAALPVVEETAVDGRRRGKPDEEAHGEGRVEEQEALRVEEDAERRGEAAGGAPGDEAARPEAEQVETEHGAEREGRALEGDVGQPEPEDLARERGEAGARVEGRA